MNHEHRLTVRALLEKRIGELRQQAERSRAIAQEQRRSADAADAEYFSDARALDDAVSALEAFDLAHPASPDPTEAS